MRLFIAVNFSPNTLSGLIEARERLRKMCLGKGSFTQDANLHLTLAFLGEVEAERAGLAAEAMEAARGRTMELVFDRAGRFKGTGGDIWWAGGPENPALAAVQRRLARGLVSRGFELEARRFIPHVTLARRVPEPEARPALFETPVTERVGALSLMRSELGRGAPRYTELERVALE